MDNILKLIVGCLGLVGLIVMIVPNSDPLAATKDDAEGTPLVTDAPSVAAGSLPPPPPAVPTENQANPSEFIVDDYDINNFGQPMVDPTPPAERNLIAQKQSANLNNNQNVNSNGEPAQSQMGGTESTGPAGPPPPPPVSGN